MTIILRSLIFNFFFIFWTTLAVLVMVLLLVFPRSVMACIVKIWARVSSDALKVLINLKFEVRGTENIAHGPAIYAAKHQSAWDTFAYFLILKNPSYVLKKELLLIPFWGWCARRYRAVIVDREGGGAALKKMVLDVKDRIARDMSVVIFPEGTRTLPGASGRYHPGVAAIYNSVDVPVIPVAVNSGLFWGRRSFKKLPGTIVIEFLPAMKSGLKRKEFMYSLQSRIERGTNNLVNDSNF